MLVKPVKEERFDLVEQYKTIVTTQLEMVPLDESVSIGAAELLAKYGLKTPDAIQVASVINRKGDVFITNDGRLEEVEEIKVLTLKDL